MHYDDDDADVDGDDVCCQPSVTIISCWLHWTRLHLQNIMVIIPDNKVLHQMIMSHEGDLSKKISNDSEHRAVSVFLVQIQLKC